MKAIFIILTVVAMSLSTLVAQEYTMANTSITACSGNFADSQGTTRNYLSGETFETTICSFFSTDRTQLDFTQFQLAPGDILFVHDGDSSAAPLIGQYQNSTSPGLIEASVSNSSGCLTFVFTSDATSPTDLGWNANISCISDCQTIISQVSTVPSRDFDGFLRICQGDTVDLSGIPSFSIDGTGSTEKFLLPDGTTVSGSNVSLTLNDPGVYLVDYIVSDANGCRDRTIEDVAIFVSTDPDFTGTEASEDIICLGDTVDITGSVVPVQHITQVAQPVVDLILIPDGSGTSISSCIDVQGFGPGQTFQNIRDLFGAYIILEHSYTGDLQIKLTAPNGSEIELFSQAGGGSYFGEPIDDNSDLRPGIGYEYRFVESGRATNTLSHEANNTSSGRSVAAGNYLPIDSFTNLIGTSLNGSWCLEITDYLSSDNGYIFEWGLEFNPNIHPTIICFPSTVQASWQQSTDVVNTSQNGNIITVQPSTAGRHCYNYEFLDDFGCTYIETVCIDVLDPSSSQPPLADYGVCEDLGSAAIIDLSNNEQNIITSTGLNILNYYPSQSDATSGTNPLNNIITLDPGVASLTIFAALGTNSCEIIKPYTITRTLAPIGVPTDLELADINGDLQEIFDLTENDTFLLNGLSPGDYEVFYYEDENSAQNMSNSILNPSNYSNTSNPQIIYGSIVNLNNGCSNYQPFAIFLTPQSTVDSDNDGVTNNLEDINANGDLTDDDTDNDLIPNYLDPDDDGDLVETLLEVRGFTIGASSNMYVYIDTDNDQIENYLDPDDDGDGVNTADEDYDGDGNPLNDDANNNQIPDYLDNTVTLSSSDIQLSQIQIYPTLVDDLIYIDARSAAVNLNSISICDLSGRSIRNLKTDSESVVEFSVAELNQGIYFLQVKSEDGNSLVKRFVKK